MTPDLLKAMDTVRRYDAGDGAVGSHEHERVSAAFRLLAREFVRMIDAGELVRVKKLEWEDNDDETRAAEPVHWRCFHCDKTFTQSQHKQAREHFGTDEGKMPVCLMRVPGEDGLLAALRRAEANLAEWQEERHPLMMALVSQAANHAAALQREEEKGYARGLKDYTKVEEERDRLRAEVAAMQQPAGTGAVAPNLLAENARLRAANAELAGHLGFAVRLLNDPATSPGSRSRSGNTNAGRPAGSER